MERTTLDLWVGLFVVAGIAAVVFLALKVGNIGTFDRAHTYSVMARFDDIGGLKERAPVKSAGVVVGRVGEIRFDTRDYEAEVVFNLNQAYQFPEDTSVAIMTSGLLGEQYVALVAGAEEKMLPAGGTFKITQGAVVLENLIGQFLYGKADEGESTSPAK